MAILSPTIRRIFKTKKVKVSYRAKKVYSKTVFRDVGFDILEYYGVIRHYVQWKYKISLGDLELLYYLYPKSFFTKADFKKFPRSWNNQRVNEFINEGLIVSMFPDRKKYTVYKLSEKSKYIVTLVHKLLSGEKKLPVAYQYNPCFSSKATYSQKRFRGIMMDMREAVDLKFNYKAYDDLNESEETNDED